MDSRDSECGHVPRIKLRTERLLHPQSWRRSFPRCQEAIITMCTCYLIIGARILDGSSGKLKAWRAGGRNSSNFGLGKHASRMVRIR